MRTVLHLAAGDENPVVTEGRAVNGGVRGAGKEKGDQNRSTWISEKKKEGKIYGDG